jgi:hypothetical protein
LVLGLLTLGLSRWLFAFGALSLVTFPLWAFPAIALGLALWFCPFDFGLLTLAFWFCPFDFGDLIWVTYDT